MGNTPQTAGQVLREMRTNALRFQLQGNNIEEDLMNMMQTKEDTIHDIIHRYESNTTPIRKKLHHIRKEKIREALEVCI